MKVEGFNNSQAALTVDVDYQKACLSIMIILSLENFGKNCFNLFCFVPTMAHKSMLGAWILKNSSSRTNTHIQMSGNNSQFYALYC